MPHPELGFSSCEIMDMPVLVALDKCSCALTKISLCVETGLQNPKLQQQVLQLIRECCDKLEETLVSVFDAVGAKTHLV